MALAFIPTGAPQRNPLVEGDVVADQGGFTNHHAHPVIDKKSPTNRGTWVNLNAREPA